MPTNRRYRKQTRRSALTSGEKSELLWGFILDGDEGFSNPGVMKETWTAFREILIPEFCKQNPGQMPHAWWVFDCHGERGFFSFRTEFETRFESEYEALVRLNLLEKAQKVGFLLPEATPRGLTSAEYHNDI